MILFSGVAPQASFTASQISTEYSISVFESLDAYSDSKCDNLMRVKTEFENGVRCFELGGGNCKKIFEKVLSEEKTDKVAKYYLDKLKVK